MLKRGLINNRNLLIVVQNREKGYGDEGFRGLIAGKSLLTKLKLINGVLRVGLSIVSLIISYLKDNKIFRKILSIL